MKALIRIHGEKLPWCHMKILASTAVQISSNFIWNDMSLAIEFMAHWPAIYFFGQVSNLYFELGFASCL